MNQPPPTHTPLPTPPGPRVHPRGHGAAVHQRQQGRHRHAAAGALQCHRRCQPGVHRGDCRPMPSPCLGCLLLYWSLCCGCPLWGALVWFLWVALSSGPWASRLDCLQPSFPPPVDLCFFLAATLSSAPQRAACCILLSAVTLAINLRCLLLCACPSAHNLSGCTLSSTAPRSTLSPSPTPYLHHHLNLNPNPLPILQVGGRYDPSKTLSDNVELTDPILSRSASNPSPPAPSRCCSRPALAAVSADLPEPPFPACLKTCALAAPKQPLERN